MKELRVASVQVRNVLGIESRALDPQGRAVVIAGRNGSNKSSLLGALQAAIGGGSLAKLARVGSEEDPEVVVVLDGPGGHFRVEKKGDQTARVQARVGESQAFEDIGKPQAWLSSLFDPGMANPVTFLQAPAKERVLMLLASLDLELDEVALDETLKDVVGHRKPIPAGLHALESLGMIREQLFNARTGVNRDLDGKEKAAKQTRLNAPAVLPEDPAAEIERLEASCGTLAAEVGRQQESAQGASREAILEADKTHGVEVEKIKASFASAKRDLLSGHRERAEAIRAEAEARIAEDLSITNTSVEGLREADEDRLSELDAARDQAKAAADAAREAALAKVKAAREELQAGRETLITLRARAEMLVSAKSTVALAEQFDAEAKEHAAESARLSAALERLDIFRRLLSDSLPIPGLTIDGKDIRRNGVLFDQLNTGQRVEIAATVATLRAARNPLKVLFLDGLESLDSDHRDALISLLSERGMQTFGAVVTDGDLDVTYIGAVRHRHVDEAVPA